MSKSIEEKNAIAEDILKDHCSIIGTGYVAAPKESVIQAMKAYHSTQLEEAAKELPSENVRYIKAIEISRKWQHIDVKDVGGSVYAGINDYDKWMYEHVTLLLSSQKAEMERLYKENEQLKVEAIFSDDYRKGIEAELKELREHKEESKQWEYDLNTERLRTESLEEELTQLKEQNERMRKELEELKAKI